MPTARLHSRHARAFASTGFTSKTSAPGRSFPTRRTSDLRGVGRRQPTLFYTTEDPVTKRSNMVWRHKLGDETEPIFQEKDRLFSLQPGRDQGSEILFIQSTSTDTYETRYLASDRPDGEFQVILPREKGHKYNVEHRDGLFYIRTNREAKNFRLVTTPVSTLRRKLETDRPARSDVLSKLSKSSRITWWLPKNQPPSSRSACSILALVPGTK